MKESMKRVNQLTRQFVTALIVCTMLVLSLTSEALGQRRLFRSQVESVVLECGDDAKIVTNDGKVIMGRISNTTDTSLVLSTNFDPLLVMPLEKISNIYRLNRRTATGFIIGGLLGTTIGFGLGANAAYGDGGGSPNVLFVGGAITGLILGGMLGYNSISMKKVNLKLSPTCLLPSGKTEPVGFSFAINF